MSNQDPKIVMLELCDALSQHKYSTVFHEAEITNNAPHHYMIVDKSSVGEDRENVKPVLLGSIDFQNGEIANGVNGVMDENLLAIVANRLTYFQASDYACKENTMALTKIEEAIMWLKKRTAERELQGIEGTDKIGG